jgi:hypothetical protein
MDVDNIVLISAYVKPFNSIKFGWIDGVFVLLRVVLA